MTATDGLSVWHWVIVALIIFLIYKVIRRAVSNGEKNLWSERGVQVDFKNKTISIKGKKYSVFDVRGIQLVQGRVHIIVNDLKNPEYEVWAGMGFSAPSKFYHQLTMALEKAGAGPFQSY
ncbi:MAG: hypothetical protein PW999_16105 [Paraburkholderia tropica]|nr:hypothetical protein [Paraburkholderia tropica]